MMLGRFLPYADLHRTNAPWGECSEAKGHVTCIIWRQDLAWLTGFVSLFLVGLLFYVLAFAVLVLHRTHPIGLQAAHLSRSAFGKEYFLFHRTRRVASNPDRHAPPLVASPQTHR